VLEYWFEKKVRKPTTACQINGLHPSNFPAVFQRNGFYHCSGAMTVADLKHHTGLGRPVIALVNFEGEGHWVVVRGVQRGRVHYQCPIDGIESLPVGGFASQWFDTDGHGIRWDNFGCTAWL